MREPHLGLGVFSTMMWMLILLLCSCSHCVYSQSSVDDPVMLALRVNLEPPNSLGWSGQNSCNWKHVACDSQNRVTKIQIGNQNLKGPLPSQLVNLSALVQFEVMQNSLTGPFPNLPDSLEILLAHDNSFTSFPPDFFAKKSSLRVFSIDHNPLASWQIPESIKDASSLQQFSANSVNITGPVPAFFGGSTFPSLSTLHMAFNNLVGELPSSFSGSMIQSLWLNGQTLNGSISVLQNMTSLEEVWLNSNQFTGPLPDFSGLVGLQNLSLRDNQLTGVVPSSLVNLKSLISVNLSNNLLQGPTPKFVSKVQLDMREGSNSFCSDTPGESCDPRVNALLSVAQAMNYPTIFAQSWKGNNPCTSSGSSDWTGIICGGTGNNSNITTINFQNKGLTGTISPSFALLMSLQSLVLSNNFLTGTIPNELTTMSNLKKLDLSNNRLHGQVPTFRSNIEVNTSGNPDIGKYKPSSPPGTPPDSNNGPPGSSSKKSSMGVVVGSIIGSIAGLVLVGGLVFFLYSKKQRHSGRVQAPNTMVIHPRHSGDQDGVKITAVTAESRPNETHLSPSSSGLSDIHVVEAGNMVISIQVLRNVTNNFSQENILGKGGFGTVYKGELHDGTKIAVKRMDSGLVGEKGLNEFKAEIAVLTKVRHRHLVGLLGYCLDGNERLLVYEYMPQGTLSRHLFNWKEEGLKPLEWTRRLSIALDVARAVEYLHGLAHQSFIHRDLKPSNILLGDDMRAKVADFGLVRLAPEGKASFETRIAGTFGYLAPEYAVTGRVTRKVDVYSFGVILMELITGRKAIDESEPEESLHLVSWFRRMHLNKGTFPKAVDHMINVDEDTFSSINTVAELAGHCTTREPYQRPDMGHAVNVLSSLVELWKPSEPDSEDQYGIDFDMSLPQALKKWQAFEGNSNLDGSSSSSLYLASGDNTQTSIPTRPSGFADSFTSADGR